MFWWRDVMFDRLRAELFWECTDIYLYLNFSRYNDGTVSWNLSFRKTDHLSYCTDVLVRFFTRSLAIILSIKFSHDISGSAPGGLNIQGTEKSHKNTATKAFLREVLDNMVSISFSYNNTTTYLVTWKSKTKDLSLLVQSVLSMEVYCQALHAVKSG